GYHVRLGQAVPVPQISFRGMTRIRQDDGTFLGVGEVSDEGCLAPRRLIATI
ncbi:MAG: tRNA pseudouridine(55) synthase TruB, partial [Gammaproteobacteria bacterium]